MPSLPSWVKWLISFNTSLMLLLIPAGVTQIWHSNEDIAVLERDVEALRNGEVSLRMADETRARFVDVEDRIQTLRESQTKIFAMIDDLRDRISRLEGALRTKTAAKDPTRKEIP